MRYAFQAVLCGELALVLLLLFENGLRFYHMAFSWVGTPPRHRLTLAPYLTHGARPLQTAALLVRLTLNSFLSPLTELTDIMSRTVDSC